MKKFLAQDLGANSNSSSLSNAYGWAGDSGMDAAFDRSDNLESTASRPLEPGSGRAEAAHMITPAQPRVVHQPLVDNTNKRWSSRNLSSDFPCRLSFYRSIQYTTNKL